MPKRWLVVAGSSYSWQYVEVDRDNKVVKVLAQSNESWSGKQGVKDEINDMKRNNDVDDSIP